MLFSMKTFVIHVSKGYEERREHIDSHLPKIGVKEYEYMLRGDIDDLSLKVINEFFSHGLTLAEKSCFYKHYLVMKKVVDDNIQQVLVLEDDAILCDDFIGRITEIKKELDGESCYLVNIEEASSQVPFVVREPGKKLYLCEANKLAGGLIYDYFFAKKMVSYIESLQQRYEIDKTIGIVRHQVGFNLFWTHPPLVKQGSKNGLFSSELSGRKSGFKTKIRAWFKDNYKKHILSNFRTKHIALFKNVKKY